MTDLKALAEAAKAAHAGGDLGAFSEAWAAWERAATPDAFLALYAERDKARAERDDLAQSLKQIMVADREAAEAALSAERAEVERLKIALADAIRRPMGVIPASAEGLITYADVAAAEERRAAALTKETPHAG